EELLRAVDRELLDLVDHLAAAVVAAAGIALGVFVRGHRAHRLEDRGPSEVLGGDQLDLPALTLELVAAQPRALGVDLVEARVLQLLERRLDRGHGLMLLGQEAGALPEDTRLRPGEIDDRGRDAGQLARVDDRAARRADLVRNVLDAPRIRPARE